MKKLVVLSLFAAATLFASSGEFQKKGFLTTEWCAKNDLFADCRLESYHCGSEGCYKNWNPGDPEKRQIVLYVHDENKIYYVKPSGVNVAELIEKGGNRNEVTLIGKLENDKKTIDVKEFKAPPPPKKSFFKGCL
ncbi:hypothetical protein [Nitratiruptor sp. SB155-2]|uniref:hypothetical protein n=1 Tax=Nitratiruptor sp. (strain SB155-2) TaxID=387092 RepID=UPI000158716F|nr:hypothetical protein [Nitratiruptor sp. SB155-2]BAF70921.1 hypothetical protein NIS_1816 [Nitratiruptor sp. SB155-2]